MSSSIRTLLQICLMFGKPQDLPSSSQLLLFSVAAAFVTLFIGYQALFDSVNPAVFAAAHVFFMGVTWFGLIKIQSRMDRWYQSASALFGCNAITNLISLPLYIQALKPGVAVSAGSVQPALALLLLPWIWELAVSTLIIRETLETTTAKAAGLAFLLSVVIQICLKTLFQPG